MAMQVATIAKAFPKGTPTTLTLTDGSTLSGEMVSVSTKGVVLRVDGKNVSRALSRIDGAERTPDTDTPDTPADLFNDDETYTTAAIAAVLDTSARELRVKLRDMNLGVGKGQTYAFTASQARNIVRRVRTEV